MRQAPIRWMVGVLTLGLALTLMAAGAPPAAGASCGTAWASQTEPPETIGVLRTASGKVETVDFKRYVVVVMASGEWPTTMPSSLLEAGALAVKQYAWFYALEGNHRDGDVNAAGQCYDVRDNSRDQVYQPKRNRPRSRRPRDACRGLSLHKNGKFFLTGYRQGSATTCGSDADSWHLYARSATDCVKRLGYDSERVLRRYYKPNLNWAWAAGMEPVDEAEQTDAEDTAGGVLDSISSWYQDLWDGPSERSVEQVAGLDSPEVVLNQGVWRWRARREPDAGSPELAWGTESHARSRSQVVASATPFEATRLRPPLGCTRTLAGIADRVAREVVLREQDVRLAGALDGAHEVGHAGLFFALLRQEPGQELLAHEVAVLAGEVRQVSDEPRDLALLLEGQLDRLEIGVERHPGGLHARDGHLASASSRYCTSLSRGWPRPTGDRSSRHLRQRLVVAPGGDRDVLLGCGELVGDVVVQGLVEA